MNYKIVCHILPWEIDYFQQLCIQLKKSKYYLDPKDQVTIHTCLNVSSYIINWDKSKLPKEFFIEKYKQLQNLLIDYPHEWNHIDNITTLYGHLDFQRDSIDKETDYYISICPDMYFSETLLCDLINTTKIVKNKYLIVTPEIYKMWDNTWDELTHEGYRHIPYKDWNKVDTFDIRNYQKFDISEDVKLREIHQFKWAGWWDLYNKAFWEELAPIQQDWHGYGGYDFYGMIISEYAKNKGMDIKQYTLENQIIFEYSVGPLSKGLGFYYKDLLSLNPIENQRENWDKNLPKYLEQWMKKY